MWTQLHPCEKWLLTNKRLNSKFWNIFLACLLKPSCSIGLLAEQKQDPGSNPVISNFYEEHLFTKDFWKYEKKAEEVGNGRIFFLKSLDQIMPLRIQILVTFKNMNLWYKYRGLLLRQKHIKIASPTKAYDNSLILW